MSPDKPSLLRYAIWPTAWGPMGAVCDERGITRIVLPHYSPADLEALLKWDHPGAARDQGPFEKLIELSRAYFNGKPADFAEVAVAMPAPLTLTGKVLAACRKIPYGRTRSYGSLAEEIGSPDAARAVAAALGKNPTPLVVPCHRVIYSDGRLGGFSAAGGTELKNRMLALEAGK